MQEGGERREGWCHASRLPEVNGSGATASSNVRESRASGNLFSLPAADKHVSGQRVCLRIRCVHYKV